MSMAGRVLLPPGSSPWGVFYSRRPDGYWVVDVNGPLRDTVDIPKHAFCRICKVPIYVGTFREEEVPLSPFEAGWRCEENHVVTLADFYNVIDNTRGKEPRILHAYRPRHERFSKTGWFTLEEANQLLESASAVANGEPDTEEFESLLKKAPAPLRRLRRPKMSADRWIAVASLVVAVIVGVIENLPDDGLVTDQFLEDLITQNQQLIDENGELVQENRDLIDEIINEDPPAVEPDTPPAG